MLELRLKSSVKRKLLGLISSLLHLTEFIVTFTALEMKRILYKHSYMLDSSVELPSTATLSFYQYQTRIIRVFFVALPCPGIEFR